MKHKRIGDHVVDYSDGSGTGYLPTLCGIRVDHFDTRECYAHIDCPECLRKRPAPYAPSKRGMIKVMGEFKQIKWVHK